MAEKVDIIDIDLSKLKSETEKASESVTELNNNLEEGKQIMEGAKNVIGNLIDKVNTLSTSADKTSQSLDETNISVNETEKQIADVNKVINKLSSEAPGDIKKVESSIEELGDAAIESQDKTEILLTAMEHTTNIAAGLTGGVLAVEGAMQLMGIESEEVTKAIQKMQAIMAITDGLRAMAEAAKSFKELRVLVLANTAATVADTTATTADTVATTADTAAKGALATATGTATVATNKLTKAMLRNPWTAIAVAILAVVTAMGTWMKSASKTEKAQKRIAKANEAVKKSIEENTTAYEREAAFMEARGENQRDILEYKRAEAKINYELAESQKNKVLADKNATKEARDNALAMVESAWQALLGINDAITIFELNTRREAKQTAIDAAKDRNQTIKDSNRELAQDMSDIDEEIYQSQLSSAELAVRQVGLQYKAIQDKYRKMRDDQIITDEQYQEIRAKIDKAIQIKHVEIIELTLAEEDALRKQNARSQEEFYWNIVQYNKGIREEGLSNFAQTMDLQMNKLDLFNHSVEAAQVGVKKFKVLSNSMFYDITKIVRDYSKIFPDKSKILKQVDTQVKAYESLIRKTRDALVAGGMSDAMAQVEANKKYGLKALQGLQKSIDDEYGHLIELVNQKNNEIQEEMNQVIPNQEKINALTADRDAMLGDISKYQVALADLNNYQLQIVDMQNQIDAFTQEETIAKLNDIRDLIQGSADSFSELNSIGGGVSDQWGAVFDSMITGLDKVQTAVQKGGKGWSKYGQMASAGLHVASSMMLAIADEQNESTEEGFEKQKKLQIAAATMSMLGGIIDAWTSAMSPANKWMTIWGQVAAGTVTSAMIAATGAMQIKAIKRQKMDGSGGDASAPVANPALSALTNLGSGVNATTEIEGASTEGKVEDQRVYVVESDITSTQNNVKTSVNEATY